MLLMMMMMMMTMMRMVSVMLITMIAIHFNLVVVLEGEPFAGVFGKNTKRKIIVNKKEERNVDSGAFAD